MDPITAFVWFIYMLPVLLTVAGLTVYLPARQDWNETFKRAALVARANLGSTKSKKVLAEEKLALNPYTGPEGDDEAKAQWEAKFTGQELMLINKDEHRIERSWNQLEKSEYDTHPHPRWWWECSCGEKESRKTKDASKQSAKRHLLLYSGRNKDQVKDVGWLRL